MPRGAVFLIDRNLCYLSASGPSVPDLVGLSPDELPGRSAEQMIPAPYRDQVLAQLRATLSGQSVEFEAVRGERTFEVRTAPIFSGEPAPVAALIHLYDVTERKQQARELENERERFRALVANAPVGIFEIDSSGSVTYTNEQWLKITGLTPEAARSPELRTRHVHPEDRLKLWQAWSAASGSGQRYEVDFRYQVEGGKPQRLSSVGAPMRAADGSVSGFIGITRDVTAQLEASESIERSLREKETLLKEIHHRVKNNLQVVGSILGLQAHRSNDERLHRVFEDVRSRIQAIALLHERLYRSPDLGAINLLEYLQGLVGDAARAAGASSGRTTVRGPTKPILLGIDDAVPVGLIANELVTNAFKHGSRGSSKAWVTVELSLADDVLELSVADDGRGFPENFEADESKTLGLLLLKSLARQLQGEVRFSSQPTR
ncbi:MAG: PAS domain S-box protein, partial [Myxococcales bacterium]